MNVTGQKLTDDDPRKGYELTAEVRAEQAEQAEQAESARRVPRDDATAPRFFVPLYRGVRVRGASRIVWFPVRPPRF